MSIEVRREEKAGYTVSNFTKKIETEGTVYRAVVGEFLQIKGHFVEATSFNAQITEDGYLHLVDVKKFDHPAIIGIRDATFVKYNPKSKEFFVFLGETTRLSVEGVPIKVVPRFSRWVIRFDPENEKWVPELVK